MAARCAGGAGPQPRGCLPLQRPQRSADAVVPCEVPCYAFEAYVRSYKVVVGDKRDQYLRRGSLPVERSNERHERRPKPVWLGNFNQSLEELPAMPTITTSDGTKIFYKDWGTGQPIVFSHGWPLSADDW